MGTSLDSRDDGHAYVGYIFQNLNAFVVNLAPDAGIGGIAERGPIDISNELPTSAREDYDLVCSILRNSVEGIDKFRVRLRGHNEWPAVAVELSDKYAFGVARQLQIAIGGEVVILRCLHSIFLSLFEPKRTSSLVHACKIMFLRPVDPGANHTLRRCEYCWTRANLVEGSFRLEIGPSTQWNRPFFLLVQGILEDSHKSGAGNRRELMSKR